MKFEGATNPPVTKLEEELVKFYDEHNYNADEFRRAYMLLCKVTESKETDRVIALTEEMERMTKQGYPLNGFVDTIKLLDKYESGSSQYVSYVESLPVTEKEKDILKSILNKNRTGELTLAINGSLEVSIKIGKSSANVHARAHALLMNLRNLMEKISLSSKTRQDVSILFEED